MKQVSVIPILNPELVNRLLNYEIRQVFSKNGDIFYVKPNESDDGYEDIFNTSLVTNIEQRLFCKVLGIKAMSTIPTYHDTCGDDERFVPSHMEVLSQIPKDLIGKVFAFEITQHIISEDEILCEKDKAALSNGYLIGSLTLFTKK